MSKNGRRDRWLMEKLFSLSLALHTPEIIYGKTLDGINNVFACAVLHGGEFFHSFKTLKMLKIKVFPSLGLNIERLKFICD